MITVCSCPILVIFVCLLAVQCHDSSTCECHHYIIMFVPRLPHSRVVKLKIYVYEMPGNGKCMFVIDGALWNVRLFSMGSRNLEVYVCKIWDFRKLEVYVCNKRGCLEIGSVRL